MDRCPRRRTTTACASAARSGRRRVREWADAARFDRARADRCRRRPRREVGQHAGANRCHLHRRRRGDRGDELASECRFPSDQATVGDFEADRVAGGEPAPGARPRSVATSRPQAVLPNDDAPRFDLPDPAPWGRLATSSSTRAPRSSTISSAPHGPSSAGRGSSTVRATTRPSIASATSAALASSSAVRWARSGSTTTPITGPGPALWSAPARGRRQCRRSVEAPQVVQLRVGRRTWSSSGASRPRHRSRLTPTAPWADPGGARLLTPRARAELAAPTPRMRDAGTRARPSGSTLAGSHNRSAHDSTAGRRSSAWSHPSSCSHRTWSVVAVEREVAHAGHERQVEQLGELGTDLAGVGVERVAGRRGPGRTPLPVRDRSRECRCRRERVAACERHVGDEHPVDLDVAFPSLCDRPRQRAFGRRRVRG